MNQEPQLSLTTKQSLIQPLVSVQDLSVDYWRSGSWHPAVRNVNFTLKPGDALGIVGESGSGKSTLVSRLLGIEHIDSRSTGEVVVAGHRILGESEVILQKLRGRIISFVPQNPLTSLTPNIRIGKQLAEGMRIHGLANRQTAWARAMDLLDQVKLPNPTIIAQRYPYQLSGGQLQRVVIAMALACRPELLVMDEPTTGLDVTTQDQILRLLRELRTSFGTTIVYVSHDLGVISELCDRVAVIYAGAIVETAPTRAMFQQPRHPYTQMLIEAIPLIAGDRTPLRSAIRARTDQPIIDDGCSFRFRCAFAQSTCAEVVPDLVSLEENHRVACLRLDAIKDAPPTIPPITVMKSNRRADSQLLLSVNDLKCSYMQRHRLLRRPPENVVHGVSFGVSPGEILAVVGESGSGKSTIAKTVIGLIEPSGGEISFDGEPLPVSYTQRSLDLRRRIQIVPQDPDSSLNPQQRVAEIIGRAVTHYGGQTGDERQSRVNAILASVRLERNYGDRYPRELSGGERQRVAIARALAAEPDLLLCDEILSALDVSTQSDIRELLRDLQRERGLAFLFISHDLAVVRELADRVVVLHNGGICEIGTVEEVFAPPYHPYTHRLLSSVPGVRSTVPEIPSFPLAATSVMTGCTYAGKCSFEIMPKCRTIAPPIQHVAGKAALYCHADLSSLYSLKEPIWNAKMDLLDE